jgi:hypothetical protein
MSGRTSARWKREDFAHQHSRRLVTAGDLTPVISRR